MSEDKKTPSDELCEAISKHFSPATSINDADELKSTIELMDEIEGLVDVDKNELYDAMKQLGFTYTYSGTGYAWLLKLR
jgi:hypothetical protein